jgi:hypothetical protein
MLTHTFGSVLFTRFINSRMMFRLLTDSLFVAIRRSNWLYSRKHRTAWYHPASSRFYLTVFILCQFQGKLTGTLLDSDARATCVKPANPACCVLGVRCWFYVNIYAHQTHARDTHTHVHDLGTSRPDHTATRLLLTLSGCFLPLFSSPHNNLDSRILPTTWTRE